ncbi:DUF445 domain-containing protein [Poseidonibacter ostreae]|jgi:uncharacterized membrane protein YheB (UPF0754 family)|uniref:DUF445 domain-containing protein n=1 Tax=Poseidonibacter ostreae TaxID=2654171 RepID=A0A6L4WVN8_9BACT|nr:DUF445 domain-containing protein [Poseidonibacter ostreae]KAB7885608.1 DUF445 domain-containing protein [Poseidonibacter ostreae]KAB7890993.1 DUF445 domain-containing protein [Poseidonibacter ostreae]KAB7892717.1 DUF445 domain-containing protein [Poseidonibacter ostreae]
MNKSDITNILTVLIMAYGYSNGYDTIFMIGLFALSGAITNTLAIHMLFEKVPYLYGSGVIEKNFTKFKSSIHNLLMNQFFTKENLTRFFQEEMKSAKNTVDFEKILNKTDFTPAYNSLKESVMESSFGGMLGMFGGEAALEPLKEPFTNKLQTSIIDITKTQAFQEVLEEAVKSDDLSEDIYNKLSQIVNKRLDELTPLMVKQMVQNIIKEHLGWLVVWGAVFGGLIGFISTFL